MVLDGELVVNNEIQIFIEGELVEQAQAAETRAAGSGSSPRQDAPSSPSPGQHDPKPITFSD